MIRLNGRAAARRGQAKDDAMAKGQKRSNKEVKKPKKEKAPPAPPASFAKAEPMTGAPKKK